MIETMLNNILQGVVIVTSKHNDTRAGLTVAWISRVSLNPPYLMISVAPERHSYEIIKNSGKCVVNVLKNEQTGMAKRFGFFSSIDKDKFADIINKETDYGTILNETLGYMECDVVGETKAGDHQIFILNPVKAELLNESAPLLFNKDDYF